MGSGVIEVRRSSTDCNRSSVSHRPERLQPTSATYETMRRALVRLAMALVGVASLVVYVAGAVLSYVALRALWADRPSALVTVLALVAVTLVGGYLSYRVGTRRLIASMPTTELTRGTAPTLFEDLDELTARIGVDSPRVLVTDTDAPNAFAVGGPDGGIVVLDRSLFSLLGRAELRAVIAHELAHLEARDGLVPLLAFAGAQTFLQIAMLAILPFVLLVTGTAKATAWIAGRPAAWTRTPAGRLRGLVTGVVMLVPAAVTLVVMAHSRGREFAADDRAATITGRPRTLASALRKIEAASARDLELRAMLGPDDEGRDVFVRLLSTHPATDARVARLLRRVE